MRKGLLQSALAAAVLCASLAYAGEPRVGKFTRYDTGEYTIVTSRGAVQAQRFMEDLVKFRVTLERMLGKRAAANAFPTTIVIILHKHAETPLSGARIENSSELNAKARKA